MLPALGLLSILFGAVHILNPHTSWPGIVNTILVGMVFGLAYLRTRQLWLPIGWHWGWNLAEASFGFPVSGLKMTGMPFVAIVSGSSLWTGGAYGPEASVPGTVVLLLGLGLVLCLPQVVPNAE